MRPVSARTNAAAPVEKRAYALPVAASGVEDLSRRLNAWLR
jgi:hypothetical protein